MDTVLFGGLGFFVSAGVCFLLIRFIDKSSLNERNKRLFNYIILNKKKVFIII